MSIKSAENPRGHRLDVKMKGPGAATVALFDSKGRALLTRRWRLSGPDNLELKSRIPLELQTRSGHVQVIPALVYRSNEKQDVTFAGEEHASFTARRAREMKLPKGSLAKIQEAMRLASDGSPKMILSASAKRVARRG